MSPTAGRLLALLALMQSRPEWTGADLAARLGVSPRTIRHDIERLRELEYPVDATRGSAGGYRLGAGGKLPPLMLDDEEAVAVGVGLRAATGLAGIELASARALTKLEQVLPARLRSTVQAIATVVDRAPENTDTDAEDPEVDPVALAAIAASVHAVEWIRFDYRGSDRALLAEPYRLIAWQRRWYLIGRDPAEGTWSVFRVDWMQLRQPTRRRFTPTPIPGGDYTAFAMRSIAISGWKVHARSRIFASAERVLDRIHPAVGMVESISADECVLLSGADSLDTLAAYIGMLGMDFVVESPDELRPVLRTYAARYLRAVDDLMEQPGRQLPARPIA